MTNFDSMYVNFQNALRIKRNIVEVSQEFTIEKNLKDMLNYMWHLEEFHASIKVEKSENSLKNDELSNNLRNMGNDYFRRVMLDKALTYYNKSIINAVFDPLHKKSQNSSRSLSYGYANRSAIFYEMHLYDLCLADIKRAFSHNYPSELHEKLIMREIKCNFSQKGIAFATETYNRYLTDEKYCHNKKLLKSLKRCMAQVGKQMPMEKKHTPDVAISPLKIFNLTEANRLFPSSSSALEFTSSEKGRGFKAKRDIMPGDILMKEKAFSAVVNDSNRLTHCSYCLKRIKYAPIPCTICTNVIYCDEQCRDEADEAFHRVECPILSTFFKLDLGKNSSLALRILCQTRLELLVEQFLLYENERLTLDQGDGDFMPKDEYLAKDLRAVLHLVTNKHLRNVPDLFKRCAMSLTIFKLFALQADYGDLPGISDVSLLHLSSEQLTVAACLFTLAMNLPCNAHGITEYNATSAEAGCCSLSEIACGAFSTFSLVNHSCAPNMARTSNGRHLVATAVQFIKAGCEIYDSYGPSFATETLSRTGCLKSQYFFTCGCIACSEDWPLHTSLPDECSLKCPNCLAMFDRDACSLCKKMAHELKTLDGTEYVDFSTIVKERSTLRERLTITKVNLINGGTEEDINQLVKIITFVSKYCMLPAKILLEAQDLMKQTFDQCFV